MPQPETSIEGQRCRSECNKMADTAKLIQYCTCPCRLERAKEQRIGCRYPLGLFRQKDEKQPTLQEGFELKKTLEGTLNQLYGSVVASEIRKWYEDANQERGHLYF